MFGLFNRLVTLSRIAMTPPKPSVNRHGLAIVAIVRNEARYIEEWTTFHYRAGVRHFFIYDNGSTDETINILQENLSVQALTLIPWSQTLSDARYKDSVIHNQVLAYAHAASNFGADYRWFAYIDVDEFLVPKQDLSLHTALAKLEEHDNVSLPWHMYGTSQHKTDPGGSVLANYQYRYNHRFTEKTALWNYKCIVDPCALTALRVHSMQTKSLWNTANDRGHCTAASQRFKHKFYSAQNIQLNHYYTRSEQEFMAKINKGHIIKSRSARYAKKLTTLLQTIDADVIRDTCAIDYLARLEQQQ